MHHWTQRALLSPLCLDFELNTLTYLAPMVHDTDVAVIPSELESILPGFSRADPLAAGPGASRVAPAETSAPLPTSSTLFEHSAGAMAAESPFLNTQQMLAGYPSALPSDPWKFADESPAYSLAAKVKQEPLAQAPAQALTHENWSAAAPAPVRNLFAERVLMPPPPAPPSRSEEASRAQLYRQRGAEPQAAMGAPLSGGIVMERHGVRVEIRPRGDSLTQTLMPAHKRTAGEAFERTPSNEALQPQQKTRQRLDESLYLEPGFVAPQMLHCPPTPIAMRPTMSPRLY